jgi:predicted dehydrogenase
MPHPSPANLGIGLVGVGRHGNRYVQHLLHDVEGVVLSALCRRSGGGLFPGTRIPVYADYREMIADPCVQAVVVVTPPSLCHDICLCAVRAGKPILIEKPLSTTGTQARAMVSAADQAGVLLMTAQTLRFDPTIVLLREQLQTIGPLRSAMLISHVETKANTIIGTAGPVPLGALLELGVHLVDLVRFLSGKEILEVQCTTDPLPSNAPETSAKVCLRTEDDILCTLDIARVEANRVGTAKWVGSIGNMTADWPARKVTKSTAMNGSQQWTVEARPTVLLTLQAFVHAIRTGTPPPVTGLDGCRAVEVADACYRSAERNGEWVRVETSL